MDGMKKSRDTQKVVFVLKKEGPGESSLYYLCWFASKTLEGCAKTLK